MEFNLKIDNESYKNLETIVTDFEKIEAMYQKQKREASNKFKIAFEAFVTDFFKLVPSVKRVVWTQFTPYFNDGDACYFRVNDPTFYNFTMDENEDYRDEEDLQEGQYALDSWECSTYNTEHETYGISDSEFQVIKFLIHVINNNETFFEEIYGDHTEITLTSDGIKIEECEHD